MAMTATPAGGTDTAAAGSSSSSSSSIIEQIVALKNQSQEDLDKQVLDIFIQLVRDVAKDDISSGQEPAVTPVTEAVAATTTIAAVSPAATAAAVQIRQQCPDVADPGALEFYLMTVWNAFIDVSQVVRYDDRVQDELVAVVEKLGSYAQTTVTLWGRTSRLWRDYPLFTQFMREAWAGPDYEFDNLSHADLCEKAAAWVNLNAFAARVTGKGLIPWIWYAVLALTDAFEKMPPVVTVSVPAPDALETSAPAPAPAPIADRHRIYYNAYVQAGCQWLLHGGTAIFREAFRGDYFDGADGQRTTQPGPLYAATGSGRAGLHMSRWWFWKQRLEELGNGNDDSQITAQVRAEALRAARHMDDIVAHDGRVIVRKLGS